MILTDIELKKVDRMRRIGRTYQEIAKLLHKRKATVLSEYHTYKGTKPIPKPSETFWTDISGKARIPQGYVWKRKSLSYQKVSSMRRKAYPSWRWQYWVKAELRLKSGTVVTEEGYSSAMKRPEQPLMREIATNMAIRVAKERYGESVTFIRLVAQRYVHWKPVKARAPRKAHKS